MKKLIACVAVLFSSLVFIKPIQARSESQTVKYAINLYWCGKIKRACPSGQKAKDVAWCESRFNKWARNGDYLGLFQMGVLPRKIYGHSRNNIWKQVRYAHEYYEDSGWSPWSCA